MSKLHEQLENIPKPASGDLLEEATIGLTIAQPGTTQAKRPSRAFVVIWVTVLVFLAALGLRKFWRPHPNEAPIVETFEKKYEKAVLLFKQGNTLLATQTAQELVKENPKNGPVLSLLAILEIHSGEIEKATQTAQTALELDPDSAMLAANLGSFFLKKGDLENGELFLERALEKNPTLPEALLALAKLHESKKNAREAVRTYEQFLQTSSTLSPYTRLVEDRLRLLRSAALAEQGGSDVVQ